MFDEETEAFLNAAFDKVAPGLNAEQRRGLLGLLSHALDHPWVDDEVKGSIIGNIANDYELPIPEKYKEEE